MDETLKMEHKTKDRGLCSPKFQKHKLSTIENGLTVRNESSFIQYVFFFIWFVNMTTAKERFLGH